MTPLVRKLATLRARLALVRVDHHAELTPLARSALAAAAHQLSLAQVQASLRKPLRAP